MSLGHDKQQIEYQRPPSRVGVSVYSWGTDPRAKETGLPYYAKKIVKGGMVGHAGVLLTIPNTPENFALIQKKLGKEYITEEDPKHIPWQQKKYVTPSIKKDGTLDYDNPSYQEEVIEIYFSWYSDPQKGHRLQTFTQDCNNARLWGGFTYSPEMEEYLQPKKRRVTHGIASSFTNRMMTLYPERVTHMVGATLPEIEFLQAYQHKMNTADDVQSLNLLQEKLSLRVSKGSSKTLRTLAPTEKYLVKLYLSDEELTEDMSCQTLLEKTELKLKKVMNEDTFALCECLQTSVAFLSPQERAQYTLSDDEKKVYERMELSRLLYQAISKVDLTPENSAEITKLIQFIKKTFKIPRYHAALEYFKDAFDDPNFPQDMDLAKLETFKVDLESRLYFANKKTMAITTKGDFTRLFPLLADFQSYQNLKSLLDKLTTALAENDEETSKTLLREINIEIAKNRILKSFYGDKKLLKEDLPTLLKQVGEGLNPETSPVIKDINALLHQPKSNIVATLSKLKMDPLLKRFVSVGYPPDVSVSLPLRTDTTPGLDPERMIDAMSAIDTTGNRFNILDNNCSVTSTAILAAGAEDAHDRQAIFELGDFNHSVINPTTVYTAARHYGASLADPDFSPKTSSYYAKALKQLSQATVHSAAVVEDSNSTHFARACHIGKGVATLAAAGALSATAKMVPGGAFVKHFHGKRKATRHAHTTAATLTAASDLTSAPISDPASTLSSDSSTLSTDSTSDSEVETSTKPKRRDDSPKA
ncbi:MAG: hypothetical protein ACHQJ6_06910 [Candidatus Berkiellales bacterium]